MKISCVWEHNGSDTLLHAVELPGAYSRGANREAAVAKMEVETVSYLRWRDGAVPETVTVEIIQEASCALDVRDADSDVLFDVERIPLSWEEYEKLKKLALRSAADFLKLYQSIPNKDRSVMPLRRTFYGQVPRTAEEMYRHTKNVNEYYFAEIGVEADNEGSILDCRLRGFATLEKQPDFLSNPVREGSWGELWGLRKLLRRFLWHDRIHARAMYRMAERTFGVGVVEDVFSFGFVREKT